MKSHWKSVGSDFDPSSISDVLPFTQSTPYFLFQQAQKREGFRFVLQSEGKNKAFVQLFEHTLVSQVQLLYAPLGPISDEVITEEEYVALIKVLRDILLKRRYSFVRLHLPSGISQCIKSPMSTRMSHFMQPIHDRRIDLSGDISAGIKKNARHAIKKAEEVIEIEQVAVSEDVIGDFLRLLNTTAGRKNIQFYNEQYYRNLFNVESEEGSVFDLFFARYKGERVAMALITKAGGNATYLFGASNAVGLETCAQYLLQISAIRKQKESGMKYYSFGGIAADQHNKKDKLHGLSLFKKNFGGYATAYNESYDYVVGYPSYAAYILYTLFKKGI